ncbi:unnamed protein product [Ostreobium quekettii]|uniref:Periplasmic binding protein domain-containing protein n=1 Tax=Ostreobium quekettii TaxID=121088 RepID=A0A8S1JE75_9CHLO|nr:unnamed protein product [Ostreobium quekettii]
MEMSGFKTARHVPALWLYVVTCFTFMSILFGIIAIALGAAAIRSTHDNEDQIAVTEERLNALGGGDTQREASVNEGPVETLIAPKPGRAFNTSRAPRSGRRQFNMAVVVHGLDSDTFWYSVQQGVLDAAELFGVHFFYDNPQNTEEQDGHLKMAEDINKARKSLRDGLAVSIPDESVLRSAIARAAEEIPVLTINSGANFSEELGAFTHIGQLEFEAGVRAGERMRDLGVTSAICVRHEVSLALDERCDGFQLGLNGTVHRTDAPAEDLSTSIQDQVRLALDENSDAQGILALGPAGFEPAKAELGDRVCSGDSAPENSDCIEFGTFDVSPGILNSLVNGEVNFGIDQQEYLQGYLAIAFLYWKAAFGGSIGSGGVVMSGPTFVDSAEQAQLLLGRNYTTMDSLSGKILTFLDIRYVVDGKPQDKFWQRVKRGVKYVANLYGTPVDYNEPENSFSNQEVINFMRDEIQRAIDDNVDGLVVSIPSDNAVLRTLVGEAMTKGIPVISMASGVDLFESWNIPLHVGMGEEFGGRQVGKRLAESGVNNAICLIHNNPDAALEERCAGLLAGMQEVIPTAQVQRLRSRETSGAGDNRFQTGQAGLSDRMRDAVVETIEADESINGVVALGPPGSVPAVEAVKQLGAECDGVKTPDSTPARGGCIVVATFDVEFPVFNFIEERSVEFAVDPGPFFQGALPLMFMALQNLWNNMPVGLVNSGPTFVDVENVGGFEVFA